MIFNRVRIGDVATEQLSVLKGRLGVTPNYICRMALCCSLEEAGIPNPEQYDQNGQEFNRYTLTGQYDPLFTALVKERLLKDGFDPETDFIEQYRAHINRGVGTIYGRVKELGGLVALI